ncbi:MAG: FlgD immunoglobulin-like domain containing protein [Spirochaetales bacterium]
MSFFKKTLIALFGIVLACALSVSGYDPPKGAFFLPSLYSPWALASTPTVTGQASPWASILNPSVTGGSQLTQVEGAYTGISDFGLGTQGWGSAAALSLSLPTPYGVWGGTARFFSAPGTMSSMPLGTFGSLRASFAKDLLDSLYVGSALDITMGGNGGFGWGIGLDLGATWFAGDLGFLKDTRFGLSILDIGKGYSTVPLTGIFGGSASSYPSAFTLGLGMRSYLVQSYNWNLDLSLDLWSPSFQDLGADLSVGFGFREYASLRLGWSFGLRDALAGSGRSLLPSFGVSGTIPLGKGIKLGKQAHRDAAISASAAIAPLYDSLIAASAGFNLSFGIKDKTPPSIDAKLPVPFGGKIFISPNGDGVQDTLEIPVSISDERYVAGWKMTVEDKSSGKVLKTFGASNDRADSISGLIAAPGRAFLYTKKSVEVPSSLVWDGRDDQGNIVPDDSYTISIRAWDDNGNQNLDYLSCMTVVVLNAKKPWGTVKSLDPTMIFSPDGDRKKDVLSFRTNGEVENSWKVDIADAAGTLVRSIELNVNGRSGPKDFEWDGTNNEGKRVPDGMYTLKLSTQDEAGNKAVSEVRNISIDTTKPAVSIAMDGSVMSPNGDGVRDTLHVQPSFESFKNLISWEIAVLNPEKNKVWSVSGAADTPPEKSYTFTGFSPDGKPMADGEYEAMVTFEYQNGYSEPKISAPFYMDRTPPSATIKLADTNNVFSPDGDGARDSFIFSLSGSEEDTWNLEIRDAQKNQKVVKSYSQNLPEALEWNGRDDQGKIVPDGDYAVYVFAVDRAGNSFATTSDTVRVDTRRPSAALSLDKDAFSPNGDGIAETVMVSPEVETMDGLISWKFSITGDAQGGAKGLFFSSDTDSALAARYVFAGKDKDGRALPEGNYKAHLELSYINGYSTKMESPAILLDRTYPSAQANVDKVIFNPAGNLEQSKVAITQSGSVEDTWTARIIDAKGNLVKSWDFANELPSITWDGLGDSGIMVADGMYRYVVSATDRAGNAFVSKEIPIQVDTLKKEAKLTASSLAFSPNGDGVKDTLTLSADATASTRLAGWNLWIAAADSGPAATTGTKAVKSWQGAAALPRSVDWDGQSDSGIAAPDGSYQAFLSVRYPNGDAAESRIGPFTVDRVPPKASVSASARLFSPNGDGILDTVTFTQEGTAGDQWRGTMSSASGDVVRRWTWNGQLESLVWDGKDSTGSIVADGLYYYELASSDAGGNSYSSGKLPISVETEKKAVRLDLDQRAFSPNGDGLRDELTLGAIVQAPERVKSYELRIVAQEGPMAMNAVRVWKGNGPVPQKVTWKGETDSGVQAPDGRYAASLTVNYLNGDEIDASAPTFLLDRVFPKISVSASLDIISPNGDGRSDNVEIRQTSMAGDDWTGTIKASDGRVVKSYAWQNEAQGFIWDGRDDTGSVVRDGSYRYSAESIDGAGNKTVSPDIVIAVETEKKAVRLDADTLAFSPNGDGKRDAITFGVRAQYPERIKNFELLIVQEGTGGAALPVKSWKGASDIRTQYQWDGVTDSGIPAPDGAYRARLAVRYLNDDSLSSEVGPFVIDRIPPQATVRLSSAIFSPNGDGRSDTVDILQDAVPGDVWQGQIISAAEKIVRSWSWDKQLSTVTWDGKNQAGSIVPDGMYFYELRSIDQADNSFVSQRLPIEVDAARKTVRFDVDQKAFSPNGDGVKDALYINIQASKTQAIKEYEIAIYALDAAGNRQANPVKAWRGSTDMKDQYAWDGRTDSGILAPDGKYQATLRILYNNDDAFSMASQAVLLDTVGPKISASASPLLFSPNGDGNKDTISIEQNSSIGDDWTGRLKNAAGAVVRTWSWKSEARSFVWDGKDSSGAIVRDGVYRYEVSATDLAGNAASAKIDGITVDGTKPKVYVTASDTGMSPNGDGVRDDVSFTIVVERREGIESWRFSLVDRKGVEKSYFGGSDSEVPARLVWDGRDLQGQVVQGDYIGKLVVKYAKGDVAQATSQMVLVDVDPPAVDISVDPEYFSPDDDGVGDRLTFGINVDGAAGIVDWKLEVYETAIVESSNPNAVGSERLFIDWSGKGKPPAKIVWDGKSPKGELVESATDYPFKFVARDALGNSTTVSGIIAVDVLVIRDGDRLKIKVPSIVFRANYADFVGLSSDIVARNEKVVARIAQILNKFPDYRIRIEGHANNVGKMLGYSATRIQNEETKELIPLSTGRAELVRTMLIGNGVDARRLSVEGLGSSEPVVSFLDVENRWKNRRVEFVLIKNQ